MSTDLPMIAWTPPWRAAVDDEAAGLQAQLEREIGRRHPLARSRPVVVGRRVDNDDVLVRLADGTFANVHLVWSRSVFGLSKEYPSWRAYASVEAFAEAMARDAAEHAAP